MSKFQINRTEISGRLGANCEVAPCNDGATSRITYSIAHNTYSRQKGEKTMWINCVQFYRTDALHRIIPQLIKGAEVLIHDSELNVDKVSTDKGERTFVELLVKNVQFLPKLARATDSQSPDSSPSSEAPLPAERDPAFVPANF